MATIAERLTIQEFDSRYGQQKPYYEFWRGKAVQKSMPTWIHGLLQGILLQLLNRAGFKAASEVRLQTDSEYQFIPDVIATHGRIELPHPVSALEVVVEILSETDSMSRILTKFRKYQGWGFEQIYLIDPGTKTVFRWQVNRLEAVDDLSGVAVREIWDSLDRLLNA